jgi:meso-butanediol dehydrogenase / (S,S)-butanediol dehydrogenase / diacetyl reductase
MRLRLPLPQVQVLLHPARQRKNNKAKGSRSHRNIEGRLIPLLLFAIRINSLSSGACESLIVQGERRLADSVRGLKGKRVVITGGASGIGAATAARFLEEGATVAILDRDQKACDEIRGRLPAIAKTILADVTAQRQVEQSFADIARELGGPDVVINNAGISIRHEFLDITPDEWNRVLAVNLTGVFYVAQTAARHMMAGAGGVILNTASTNGITGYPYYADYNASKAGVIELTRSMALELAPKVRVNAVAPGYVLTPMQRAEYSDEMLEAVNQKIPLRRHARPEEVAALFAFLASDDAAYLNGHVYVIDGAEIAGGLASR